MRGIEVCTWGERRLCLGKKIERRGTGSTKERRNSKGGGMEGDRDEGNEGQLEKGKGLARGWKGHHKTLIVLATSLQATTFSYGEREKDIWDIFQSKHEGRNSDMCR